MAEKDQPMFRDFLGLSHMDEVKQAEFPSSNALQDFRSGPSLKVEVDPETFATRASSGTVGQVETRNSPDFVSPPFGLAPATTSAEPVYWQRGKAGAIQHHGIKSAFYKPDLDSSKLSKKRESPCGRESLQDRLVEALESSRSQKTARFDKQKKEKVLDYRESPPSASDLHLSMQPPQPSTKSPTWYQQNLKPDVSNRQGKKTESLKPLFSNPGLPIRCLRPSHAIAETAAATAPKENSPQIGHPAEDEGSRTGLKSSPLVGLLRNAGLLHESAAPAATGSSGPPPASKQLKSSTRSGDFMLPSGYLYLKSVQFFSSTDMDGVCCMGSEPFHVWCV